MVREFTGFDTFAQLWTFYDVALDTCPWVRDSAQDTRSSYTWFMAFSWHIHSGTEVPAMATLLGVTEETVHEHFREWGMAYHTLSQMFKGMATVAAMQGRCPPGFEDTIGLMTLLIDGHYQRSFSPSDWATNAALYSDKEAAYAVQRLVLGHMNGCAIGTLPACSSRHGEARIVSYMFLHLMARPGDKWIGDKAYNFLRKLLAALSVEVYVAAKNDVVDPRTGENAPSEEQQGMTTEICAARWFIEAINARIAGWDVTNKILKPTDMSKLHYYEIAAGLQNIVYAPCAPLAVRTDISPRTPYLVALIARSESDDAMDVYSRAELDASVAVENHLRSKLKPLPPVAVAMSPRSRSARERATLIPGSSCLLGLWRRS